MCLEERVVPPLLGMGLFFYFPALEGQESTLPGLLQADFMLPKRKLSNNRNDTRVDLRYNNTEQNYIYILS